MQQPLKLLALSADNEPALDQALLHLSSRHSDPNGTHRAALIALSADDFSSATVIRGVAQPQLNIAFLFTGQGAQYASMGKILFESQPVFKDAILQCAAHLDATLEKPLTELLFNDENADLLNQTANTQPALFAIEYATSKLWESWGITPNFVIGHSVGEFAAATIAGVMRLEDGLTLIAERARLMQALPAGGTMAAVLSDQQTVQRVIDDYSGTGIIDIAGINGPKQTVISGDIATVETICDTLKQQNIISKVLQVSHAFHSARMDPMLDEFEAVAQTISYNPPHIPLISNVTANACDSDTINANYWRQHVRSPVNFTGGMETLSKSGCNVYIEVGPHPVLIGMGKRCIESTDHTLWLPSLQRNKDDGQRLLNSLAELYVNGANIDWANFEKSQKESIAREV